MTTAMPAMSRLRLTLMHVMPLNVRVVFDLSPVPTICAFAHKAPRIRSKLPFAMLAAKAKCRSFKIE